MKSPTLFLTSLIVTCVLAENIENSDVQQSLDTPRAREQASYNDSRIWICGQPKGAVEKWYYSSPSNGPNYCAKYGDSSDWAMLNAYRSGGQENVHWKYTNNENDSQCLVNWKYYRSDGRGLIATVGRTTTINDSRRWCALPVYRPGGQLAKQWAYCICF